MKKTRTVAIRVTESEFESLKDKALQANVSMTDYIHNALFSQAHNILTIDRILNRIKELKTSNLLSTGDITTISALFDRHEYAQYVNVIPIGRTFALMAQNKNTAVYAVIELIPHTKPARYKIK